MGNSPGFMYLEQKFPKINEAKIKEGIFVGPQIWLLMQDEKFEELLNPLEKVASIQKSYSVFWEIERRKITVILSMIL